MGKESKSREGRKHPGSATEAVGFGLVFFGWAGVVLSAGHATSGVFLIFATIVWGVGVIEKYLRGIWEMLDDERVERAAERRQRAETARRSKPAPH